MNFKDNMLKSIIAIYMLQIIFCYGLSKFTNIQCFNLDENFSHFSECRMRAVKRDVTEINIKAKLLQSITANITMRWQLMKKASGYKPFLYDVSADVCDYLEKPNHPFINIILHSFGNHSIKVQKCPINDEIGLVQFQFPMKTLESLPLPFGEYGLFSTFTVQGIERAAIKAYFVLTEF
ncbi:uncharacterized protein LOC119685406 [Teleopsis dalmanni]|uniref:uncharacterized protein LOC119685406 n=1 Tax=Teleopsis dalmanni TaxID=139649 RepID=UPI0018CD8A7B|nr:uncharacterized protein LOC119685406 [Teleopsis dalmanni]